MGCSTHGHVFPRAKIAWQEFRDQNQSGVVLLEMTRAVTRRMPRVPHRQVQARFCLI
jgi:hypothetical protein